MEEDIDDEKNKNVIKRLLNPGLTRCHLVAMEENLAVFVAKKEILQETRKREWRIASCSPRYTWKCLLRSERRR